jgi:hypothetical protein
MIAMARTNRAAGILAAMMILLAAGAPPALAQPDQPADQPPAGEIQRLHGVIDKDQTWSGSILITGDVTIQDATITISPGTTIEFAQAEPQIHPTLTVGTAASATGELKVLGTAQQPVTFRTREGTNAGRLVVNIRSKLIANQPRSLGTKPTTQPSAVPNDVTWRYVRFDNLGYSKTTRGGLKAAVVEPAASFNAIGGGHTLQISDCTFIGCTRLEIRAADAAKVTVAGNRFSDEKEKTAIEVIANELTGQAESVLVTGNFAAAAISISGSADIAENILIGLSAAIILRNDSAAGTKIQGNYVHNTTSDDDGRYCLNCENPNALIDGNILRGGTACVLNGSKRMSNNALIAAAHLDSKYVKNARTHQLVAALPAGATFERNLLLGPAYSMLAPQPAALTKDAEPAKGPTIIRHNLFDGFSDSNRAIHVNNAGRGSAPIAVLNNAFLRMQTLVYDEGNTDNTLTYEDYNALAPAPDRPFEQVKIAGIKPGSAGWGASDVRLADVASLQLAAVPKEPPADFDAELSAGKTGVAQLRRRLFDAYRPLPSSPLVKAGRGDGGTEGVSGARPTIGPSEPGDKN